MTKSTENKHEFKWLDAGFMLDQAECSCGWRSQVYFDGDVYAWHEWKNHVKKEEQNDSNSL